MDRRQTIGLLGLAAGLRLTAGTDHDRFPGIYKLVSWKTMNPDGTVIEPLGSDPIGRITYHKSGHMSVQLMRRDRKPLPRLDIQTASIDELRTALRAAQGGAAGGFVAYMGTYDVHEDRSIVIHQLEGGSAANMAGSDFERHYEFSGKNLVLSVPPSLTAKIVWERVADA
jgi:hypothetical protein